MLTAFSRNASGSGTDIVAGGAPRLFLRESGEADSEARFRFCPGVLERSVRSGCSIAIGAAILCFSEKRMLARHSQ